MYIVYILRGKITGRFYTGSTSDLSRGPAEHNASLSTSTKNRGPWELIYREDYPTRADAMRRERELKTGKGRDELKQIISAEKRAQLSWKEVAAATLLSGGSGVPFDSAQGKLVPPGAPDWRGSNPDTWVTERTGYIGNNLGPNGFPAVPAPESRDRSIPDRNP
jgi:putative endonuclease